MPAKMRTKQIATNMKNVFIHLGIQMRLKMSKYVYSPRRKQHILVLIITVFIVVHLVMEYIEYLEYYDKSTDINTLLRSNMCKRMNLTVTITKPSIAASFGEGRTANQLCEFATGYALWREYGILNYIEKRQLSTLEQTFQLPKLDEDNNNSPYYVWREGKYSNETQINTKIVDLHKSK